MDNNNVFRVKYPGQSLPKPLQEYDEVIGPDGVTYYPKKIYGKTRLIITNLIEGNPAFAFYFNYLKVVYTFQVATMATDGKHIFINPGFFMKCEAMKKSVAAAFVLTHELYHNVFWHFEREKKQPDKYAGKHKLCNIAQDYEINLAIEGEEPIFKGVTDMMGGCIDEQYKEMTWEEIFEKIKDEPFDNMNPQDMPSPDSDSQESQDSQGGQGEGGGSGRGSQENKVSDDWKNGYRDGWNKAIEEAIKAGIISERLKIDYSINRLILEGYETFDEGYDEGYKAAQKAIQDMLSGKTGQQGNGQPLEIDGLKEIPGMPAPQMPQGAQQQSQTQKQGEDQQGQSQGQDGQQSQSQQGTAQAQQNQQGQGAGQGQQSVDANAADLSGGGGYDGSQEQGEYQDVLTPSQGELLAKNAGVIEIEDPDKIPEESPFDLTKPANLKRLKDSHPGKGLQSVINKIEKSLKPKFNWKDELKHMLKGYFNKEGIRGHKSKYIHQGRYVYQTRKVEETMRRMIFLIDTSGSVFGTPNALNQFVSEITAIASEVGAKTFECIMFADGVYDHRTYTKSTIPNDLEIKATGGTNYFKPLQYVQSKFADNNKSFQCVLCLTDTDLFYAGASGIPKKPDWGDKMVWYVVNTDDDKKYSVPYGKLLSIPQSIWADIDKKFIKNTNESMKELTRKYIKRLHTPSNRRMNEVLSFDDEEDYDEEAESKSIEVLNNNLRKQSIEETKAWMKNALQWEEGKEYEINPKTFKIDVIVDKPVRITGIGVLGRGIPKGLVKFGHVPNDFVIGMNPYIKDLEGCPDTVDGTFYCYNMSGLKSLKGGPKRVMGDYIVRNCPIESLEGAPESLGGVFSSDKFSDDDYIDSIVNEDLKSTTAKDKKLLETIVNKFGPDNVRKYIMNEAFESNIMRMLASVPGNKDMLNNLRQLHIEWDKIQDKQILHVGKIGAAIATRRRAPDSLVIWCNKDNEILLISQDKIFLYNNLNVSTFNELVKHDEIENTYLINVNYWEDMNKRKAKEAKRQQLNRGRFMFGKNASDDNPAMVKYGYDGTNSFKRREAPQDAYMTDTLVKDLNTSRYDYNIVIKNIEKMIDDINSYAKQVRKQLIAAYEKIEDDEVFDDLYVKFIKSPRNEFIEEAQSDIKNLKERSTDRPLDGNRRRKEFNDISKWENDVVEKYRRTLKNFAEVQRYIKRFTKNKK